MNRTYQGECSSARFSMRVIGVPVIAFLTGCVDAPHIYEPDPEGLKKVETRVQESTFETATLIDPKTALADHQAFMDAYYEGNPEIISSGLHRLADLYMIMDIEWCT